MHDFLYDTWKMFVFQGMYLLGYIVWGVCGQYRACGLKESSALVVVAINKMDGYAALGVASRYNRFVYAVAIHPFATMLGQ